MKDKVNGLGPVLALVLSTTGLTLWWLLIFHVGVFLWVAAGSWGLALVTGVVLRVHWWRERRRQERERIPRAVVL
jgi:hypothetical protein